MNWWRLNQQHSHALPNTTQLTHIGYPPETPFLRRVENLNKAVGCYDLSNICNIDETQLLFDDLCGSYKTIPVWKCFELIASMIAAGCPSLIQPLDVSVNKPLKERFGLLQIKQSMTIGIKKIQHLPNGLLGSDGS